MIDHQINEEMIFRESEAVEAAAFVALGGLAAKLLSRDAVVRIENRSVIRGFVDFVDQRWVELVRSFGH
jgi:hypothetical protein